VADDQARCGLVRVDARGGGAQYGAELAGHSRSPYGSGGCSSSSLRRCSAKIP
jgi:hypothetical protein